MSRALAMSLTVLSLGLLAGCGTSGGGGGGGGGDGFNPGSTPVTAAMPSSNPGPVATGTLAPGEIRFFRVTVSSTVAANSEVLYYEVDVGEDGEQDGANTILLRLYNTDGNVLASSRTYDWFGEGTEAELATAEDDSYGALAVGVERPCFGPCIIEDSGFGTRYLRLQNTAGVSYRYALYAYGFDLQDSNENGNDNESGAVPMSAPVGGSDVEEGAIETIGDIDYFSVATGNQLYFSAAADNPVALRLQFVGESTLYEPGELPLNVGPGDIFRVFSIEERAGSPDASLYFLELQN